MRHFNLEAIETKINIRGIKAKTIVHSDTRTIKNLILNQGESIPNHQVPVDVTFFVIEGEGTITIDGTSYHIKKHDTVLCPPNTVMSVKADKNSNLSFINIKTPGIIVTK